MLETSAQNLVVWLESTLQNILDNFNAWASDHLWRIAVYIVGAWIIRRIATQAVHRVLKHTVRGDGYPTKTDREKRIRTLHSLFTGIISLVVYIVTTILVIGEIDPGITTALFASAGLIGVAFGFGAQTLIRDLVSGIFIIIENQYRIGDEVSLVGLAGVGQVEGTVEDLTIRTTIMRDLSGNVHHIPNGNIGLTTNKTLGFSRMNEYITVALETDLAKLEKVVGKVGEELVAMEDLKNKLLEAPSLVSVRGFSDNGVIVRITAKTAPAAQWKVRSEFYRHLKAAFDKHKIQLAGLSESSDNED